MSQRLGYWKDCWVYTKQSERDNMKAIIKLLKENSTLCRTAIMRGLKKSHHSINNALNHLLIIRVVKVKQHGEVKIYSLNKGWEERLRGALKEYTLTGNQ